MLCNEESAFQDSQTDSQRRGFDTSYHNSNIFFPKEIMLSPVLSPEVQELNENANINETSTHARRGSLRHHILQHDKPDEDIDTIFNSPKLKSNIYHPDMIQRELTSPQAIPLSPITSPQLRPLSLADPPPAFDFSDDILKYGNSAPPKHPPAYIDVMKHDGVDINSNHSIPSLMIPKIMVNKSQESLVSNKATNSIRDQLSSNKDDSKKHDNDTSLGSIEEDGDIASGFSFHGSNLPSGILRSQSSNLFPTANRRKSIQDILPSTIRNDTMFFNDLNQLLDDSHFGETDMDINNNNNNNTDHLNVGTSAPSSSIGQSCRSSFDRSFVDISKDSANTQPLLDTSESRNNLDMDYSMNRSRDSIDEIPKLPMDPSVDITALYDRNPNVWHPLQSETGFLPLSPVLSSDFHVFPDQLAKNKEEEESTSDNNRELGLTDASSSRKSDILDRQSDEFESKPIFNTIDNEALGTPEASVI